MSSFYREFSKKIRRIWDLANKIDKPIHNNITWTFGIINGRGDFLDLQAHGLALASSIVINEPVVPKIICAWDMHYDIKKKEVRLRYKHYPTYLLSVFSDWSEDMIKNKKRMKENYCFESRYIDLHRSGFSVDPYPWGLGLGYRSKYLGLNYVMTSHAIMSDIDTICSRPCLHVLEEEMNKNPNTFCLTNHINDTNASVGLLLFNMDKYRKYFLPLYMKSYWKQYRADSTFIPTVRRLFREYNEVLDIRTFDKHIINAEKFSPCGKRGTTWVEDTSHYHAWKGEIYKGGNKFFDMYNSILSNLEEKAKSILKSQDK